MMYKNLLLMMLWYLERQHQMEYFHPIPRSYDTILSGGDLQFPTAKGINP